MIKLINLYATSFYGSGTWDLFSKECERLFKSWNVTIRNVFNLDRCTHRYLVEQISGCPHPKVMLASRYVTFAKSLMTSAKLCVRYLARCNQADYRTLFGRTLQRIKVECGIPADVKDLHPGIVKKNMKYCKVKEGEEWRVNILKELLEVKAKDLKINGFENEEIEILIQHLCIS